MEGMRRSPALWLSVSVVLAASVLLAGCTTPEQAPTGTAAPSESPTPEPSAGPSETPSAPVATPVDIPCDTLVSLQAMYDVNPNFSLLGAWDAAAGTPAAEALAADGVICRWRNDTSGDDIDISVAALDAAALEEKANAADASSTMVPTYGPDEAYFGVIDGVGEAVVFHGTYWVVVRSVVFYEPGDAEPIVAAVLSAL